MAKLPTTMRAAAIGRFGGPEVLSIHKLPLPALGRYDVLIKLHTVGVGPWDAWIRKGGEPRRGKRFPLVLGTDGAGTVAAVGSGVRRFRAGDRVYAYDYERAGFYAEYVAVPSSNAGHVPKGLDLGHAGAIAATGLTALQGIDDALLVRKREALIVHGASGGVGSLAIQFAKRRSARVIATASGDDGVAFVRKLGADLSVNGREDDIFAASRCFAPHGVDAVLGLAGGDELERCLDAVRQGGRVAYPNGIEPEPRKRRNLQMLSYDAVAGVREFERLGRAITATRPKIPIAARYSLARAAKAHERLAEGHVLGKIVLRIA